MGPGSHIATKKKSHIFLLKKFPNNSSSETQLKPLCKDLLIVLQYAGIKFQTDRASEVRLQASQPATMECILDTPTAELDEFLHGILAFDNDKGYSILYSFTNFALQLISIYERCLLFCAFLFLWNGRANKLP